MMSQQKSIAPIVARFFAGTPYENKVIEYF